MPNSSTVWRLSDLVEAALDLSPAHAIRARRDEIASILWVDSLVDDDGVAIPLGPCTNRFRKSGWVFIYARVSTPKQKEREMAGEGWSMRTQIERSIRYCIAKGWRFCIFSDATLSGGLPTNDAGLIETIWSRKAKVYVSVMRAIFLPEYMPPRPSAEIVALEKYIERRRQLILKGKVNQVSEFKEGNEEERFDKQFASINHKGQEVITVSYRPGLNHLLKLLPECAQLVVTDSSRVARSQYLMQFILERLRNHDVETLGLIEEWDWPNRDDIGAAVQGGVLPALHEDIIRSATANTLRGVRTRLERGEQHGQLPFWYVKVKQGQLCPFCGEKEWEKLKSEHHLCPERVNHVQAMVRLYLDEGDDTERGYARVAGGMEELGIPAKRASIWHWTSVKKVLSNPALIGIEREFGLEWATLDRVISDDDWLRIGHKQRSRSNWMEQHGRLQGEQARHLLTGLLTCGVVLADGTTCGKGMSFTSSKGSDRYMCNVHKYARGHGVSHARVKAVAVDGFFDSIFDVAAEFALSYITDDDRSLFERRSSDVKAELLKLTRDIPLLENSAQQQAEQEIDQISRYAQAKGTDAYKQMVDGAVRVEMEPHYKRRDALRSRLNVLEREYADASPLSRLSDAQRAFSLWSKLSIEQKNAFLRTYFFRIIMERDADGSEWLRPVLRDEIQEWPRIAVKAVKTRYGFSRVLPEPRSYVMDTLLRHVPASVLAGVGETAQKAQ